MTLCEGNEEFVEYLELLVEEDPRAVKGLYLNLRQGLKGRTQFVVVAVVVVVVVVVAVVVVGVVVVRKMVSVVGVDILIQVVILSEGEVLMF